MPPVQYCLQVTGFYVDGRYNDDEASDDDLDCIRLCKGYSGGLSVQPKNWFKAHHCTP